MKIEMIAARLFKMNDEVWVKHSNPMSVWSRVLTLLPLSGVLYWREYFGTYLLPIVFVFILWLWLNPRIFPVPRSNDNWAARAVFGEKLLTSAYRENIAAHHRQPVFFTKLITGIGFVLLLIGIWKIDFTAYCCGLTIVYLGKFWFLDRMNWIYRDQAEHDPEVASWIY